MTVALLEIASSDFHKLVVVFIKTRYERMKVLSKRELLTFFCV